MKASVRKWGNSASIRIPAAIMQAARLGLDQTVDIREEAGRIIIEPVAEAEENLKTLLAGITNENLHTETDSGAPVGGEVW